MYKSRVTICRAIFGSRCIVELLISSLWKLKFYPWALKELGWLGRNLQQPCMARHIHSSYPILGFLRRAEIWIIKFISVTYTLSFEHLILTSNNDCICTSMDNVRFLNLVLLLFLILTLGGNFFLTANSTLSIWSPIVFWGYGHLLF